MLEVTQMKNAERRDYVKREDILELLSADEVTNLNRAETAKGLAEGDEYLDFEHLADGVRKALSPTMPMGQVLPKKAVRQATWAKILLRLSSSEGAAPRH